MYDYIDTNEKLIILCQELESEKVLGIDIECENNLHHYGAYISLIQISSLEKNYIVDILNLTEFKCLINILENKKIQKIFHGLDFDFRILNHELGCIPKNVFDTQIAALLLGKNDIGLGALIKEYFDVEKIKKFQKADWTRRPLTEEMLNYAAGDTIYLIKLRDFLVKELKQKNRLTWAEEDFLEVEKKKWNYEEGNFESVKGYVHLTPSQRAIFKRLYILRNKLAKKIDRPIHFVISNKLLIEFSANHPKNWHSVSGVHPIVRQNSKKFFNEVKLGSSEKCELAIKTNKKFNLKQKALFDQLSEIQKKVGEPLGIKPHLIMNKEAMIEIVVNGNLDGLKKWQRDLVEEEWQKIVK
jgi:ribonuclease D